MIEIIITCIMISSFIEHNKKLGFSMFFWSRHNNWVSGSPAVQAVVQAKRRLLVMEISSRTALPIVHTNKILLFSVDWMPNALNSLMFLVIWEPSHPSFPSCITTFLMCEELCSPFTNWLTTLQENNHSIEMKAVSLDGFQGTAAAVGD